MGDCGRRGERLPGVCEVATSYTGYDAWGIGCADPEAVKRQLEQG